MKTTVATFALLFLTAFPAFAEAIPGYDAILQKDYNECMNGSTAQQDPQRNMYCNCVRDNMRTWTLDANGDVIIEGTKASNATEVQDKVQVIAKACIAKILK